MQKSSSILISYSMTKQANKAKGLSALFSAVGNAVGKVTTPVSNQWMKIPGKARYGIGLAGTAAIPAGMYFGGKMEAEDHIAQKAYDDAYNLTQNRIGQEWEKMPSWQRYAVSAIGPSNAMALKEWWNSPGQGLQYYSMDGMGNKKYY
jgi:hypothetical protein